VGRPPDLTDPAPDDAGTVASVVIDYDVYELDDDPARVDRDALWAFLSEEAYWARWRTKADVDHQLTLAWRVVGVYSVVEGRMVGFARAVSDGVAFAYLADLYIASEVRGRGLAKELVRVMIEQGPGVSFRWALHAADAHGLYEPFGFTRPDQTYLERPARHRST